MFSSDLELSIEIMSGPDDGRVLHYRRGDGHGSTGPGGTWKLTIGRREDCDICLPFDTQISRLHAVLICQADSLALEDSGSRNGTYIGKEKRPIEEISPLTEDVLFRVGRTWLRIRR